MSLNSPKELDVSDLFKLFPSALGEKLFNKGRTQDKTFLQQQEFYLERFFNEKRSAITPWNIQAYSVIKFSFFFSNKKYRIR